jgi:hypothetical protein
MKKILSFALLLATMLVCASSAVGAPVDYNYEVYLLDTNTVSGIGDILYVDLYVEGEINYNGFKAQINFDADVLEFTGSNNLKGFTDSVALLDDGKIAAVTVPTLNMLTGAPCSPGDRVVTLEFKVVKNFITTELYLQDIVVNPRGGITGTTISIPPISDPLIIGSVPSGDYDYTVEYYYDDTIDSSLTYTDLAAYGSLVSTYPPQPKTGYKLDHDDTPLTITAVVANNVIKVYYVRDDFDYTVEYYYDGTIDSSLTYTGTATFGNQVSTYPPQPKTGYKFDHDDTPLTITAVVANNVIKVYYVRDDFFFFNDTATTEIYTHNDTLSLHAALPI